ncbi:MAG: hypothetical protein AAGC68_16145, partial [Verrucomicrobiota bacterium]
SKRRVMASYIERAELLKKQLTKEGNLEEAQKADEFAKEIAAELNTGDIRGVLWELKSANDFQLVRDCSAEFNGKSWKLTSPHKHLSFLDTSELFSPPFLVAARVGTDSIGLRFYFAGQEVVIFNWESTPTELRIKRPRDRKAVGIRDQGFIENNRLHEVEIEMLANRIRVLVNGDVRGEVDGDFSDLKGSFGVGPANGSTITLEMFQVRQPD